MLTLGRYIIASKIKAIFTCFSISLLLIQFCSCTTQNYMHIQMTLLYCFLWDKHFRITIIYYLYSPNSKLITEVGHLTQRKLIIITLLSCTFYSKFSFSPTTFIFFKWCNPKKYGLSGIFFSLEEILSNTEMNCEVNSELR